MLVDDAHLQLLFGDGDDGVGGDLGAGAGGGGDQDDGHALLGHAGVVQQFLDAVIIGDQDAGQLGGVHDAAAAAGHDQVRAAVLELVHQLLHCHVAGLGGQVIQDVVVGAGGLDGLLGQGEQAGGLDTLVGEHGYLLGAPRFDDGGDVVHGVLAAIDGVRHFQVVLSQHKNLLPTIFLFHPSRLDDMCVQSGHLQGNFPVRVCEAEGRVRGSPGNFVPREIPGGRNSVLRSRQKWVPPGKRALARFIWSLGRRWGCTGPHAPVLRPARPPRGSGRT